MAEAAAKVGVDDFFATGGTVAELKLLARPYDPADFATVRLGRDERLRRGIEDLWRKWRELPTRKQPDCTDRSTAREILRVAERSGKPVEDGIMVRVSVRTLALATRISTRSQSKSLERLAGAGFLRRLEEPDKPKEQAAAYVLSTPWGGGSAESKHNGEKIEAEGERRQAPETFSPLSESTYDRGVYFTRVPSDEVPELRWSKLILYWATVKGRRKVVDWHHVPRVGKKRGAILEYLLDRGGASAVPELMERFASPRTRPRDFHARMLDPLQADGMIVVDGADVTLTDEWREALEAVREDTDEPEDNRRQAQRIAEGRRNFRRRNEHPADKEPKLLGKERTAEILEERRKDEERRWIEEQRQKVGTTAAVFLADVLEDASGYRWQELRTLWLERGGNVEDLRRAVIYGPFRFEREAVDDGQLYVYPGTSGKPSEAPASVAPLHQEYTGPNEQLWRQRQERRQEPKPHTPARPQKPYKRADGVYVHPPECACEWCADPPVTSYARIGGMA